MTSAYTTRPSGVDSYHTADPAFGLLLSTGPLNTRTPCPLSLASVIVVDPRPGLSGRSGGFLAGSILHLAKVILYCRVILCCHCAGLVNGKTLLFRNAPFAAARIKVTPPMSILTTALRRFTGSLLTTSWNGYKFTTTKSIGSILLSLRYFSWTGSFQSPR